MEYLDRVYFVLGVVFIRKYRGLESFSFLKLPRNLPKVIFSAVFLGIFLHISSSVLYQLSLRFMAAGQSPIWLRGVAERGFIGVFFTFFLGGILIPFSEELFYRGFVIDTLKNRWGIYAAIASSILLFVATHPLGPVSIQYFFVGGILVLIYIRYNSIIPAFITHGVINTIRMLILMATP
jgi:membrane protease YdiL (CAAX protease family)